MPQLTKELERGNLVVQVTVRSATGWDSYQERVLFRQVYTMVTGKENYTGVDYWTPEVQALNDFVELVNRTVSVSGLPIVWPTPQSSEKDLCAGFEYIKQIPLTIFQAWKNMLDDVDKAPGDPDLFPPEELTEEQKKAPS